MLDLKKIVLPAAVEVAGRLYPIKTDFRTWLLFAEMITEPRPVTDFNFIYQDKTPPDLTAGFNAFFDFFQNKQTLPRPTNNGNNEILIDFSLDADLIYSAFYEVYKIDLLSAESNQLHWWKFQALLNGLHDTKLNEVMGYRGYNENDKREYKDQMKEARRCWHIPTKEDHEAAKSRAFFNSLMQKK